MALEIKFNPDLEHQKHALESVVNLFDGFEPWQQNRWEFGAEIISNLSPVDSFDPSWLKDNLQAVQRLNNASGRGATLDVSSTLELDTGLVLEGAGHGSHECPHFTVEMETGTGKTYVYLRTLRELFERHGWRKFVIVVPSVAIFEGVKSSFHALKAHFAQLYGNEPVNLIEYSGAQLGRIRDFASSPQPSILLITLGSFNKMSNNFFKPTEKLAGELLPFEYVQQTRPIVILDEPQNMESDKAQQAVRTLHPLFVLRYSATHKSNPNLVYRLTPVDAFKQRLVKQIEVIGVSDLDLKSVNDLQLLEVTRGSPLTALVRCLVADGSQVTEKDVQLKKGDRLFDKTRLEVHRGASVTNIVFGKRNDPSKVEFDALPELTDQQDLSNREDVFRAQIEQTILMHLGRQERLRPFGVKVLSLFFIDKVANYVRADGLIRRLFDESFDRLKKNYPEFAKYSASGVHEGYFARNKDGNAIETSGEDKTSERDAERQAFELIMRKKERLLSFEEPVSFVFAHSALKEGWDNPNVFQICTLNNTRSTLKKRQEIGRGLRLCVNQAGERPDGFLYNTLTVVANESYESYVSSLQHEYQEDGIDLPDSMKPKRPKAGEVKRRNHLFDLPDFDAFWDKLCQRLEYTIAIDTDKLVRECLVRITKETFPDPALHLSRGRFVMKNYHLVVKHFEGERVLVNITIESSNEKDASIVLPLKEGDDLAKSFADLRGFRVKRIFQKYGETRVEFNNGAEISENERYSCAVKQVVPSATRERVVSRQNYPVGNLIDRVADRTGLTRTTVLRIFKGVDDRIKAKLFKNPEAWTNTFTRAVEQALADHIAQQLEFHAPHALGLTKEQLFPEWLEQPQHELIAGGDKGLYDKIQIDSDVEKHFVQGSLADDADNIVFYFKFPPKFKIGLPKVIGNYNPDWGIVRQTPDGVKLELVRETKGSERVESLRFPHEKRKVHIAERYFQLLGLDYRMVTDESQNYWQTDLSQRVNFE